MKKLLLHTIISLLPATFIICSGFPSPAKRTSEISGDQKSGIDHSLMNINIDCSKSLSNEFSLNRLLLCASDVPYSLKEKNILMKRCIDNCNLSYLPNNRKVTLSKKVFRIERRNKLIRLSKHNFIFFDIFCMSSGMFSKKGFDNLQTNSFEIRAKGLLNLLVKLSDDSAIKFVSDHFDFRYRRLKYSYSNIIESGFNELTLVINILNF